MDSLPVDFMESHILQIKDALLYTSEGSLAFVSANSLKRLFRRTERTLNNNKEK